MAATTDGPVSSAVTTASGVVTFVAFAYVVVLLFEQLMLGVVVGAATGVGSALFLEYVLRMQDGERDTDSGVTAARNGVHRGAAGLALLGAGFVVFVAMFVVENSPLVVGAGVVVAALDYVVVSRVLPRPAG